MKNLLLLTVLFTVASHLMSMSLDNKEKSEHTLVKTLNLEMLDMVNPMSLARLAFPNDVPIKAIQMWPKKNAIVLVHGYFFTSEKVLAAITKTLKINPGINVLNNDKSWLQPLDDRLKGHVKAFLRGSLGDYTQLRSAIFENWDALDESNRMSVLTTINTVFEHTFQDYQRFIIKYLPATDILHYLSEV